MRKMIDNESWMLQMQYLTMHKALGPRRAAILSVVSLYDPVEPSIIKCAFLLLASQFSWAALSSLALQIPCMAYRSTLH